MRYLPVTIQNKIAVYASTERLICYNSDYVLQFTFDTEWETYTQKTAQIRYFQRSGGWMKHNIIFSGVECAVPVIPNASVLYVGVYAGDISTSTEAEIPCRPSALSFDGSPAEPPEDVYNQIMDLLNKLGETGASPEQIQAVLEQYIAAGNLTPNKIGAVAQNQGEENADKILGIDAAGKVVPVDKPSGGTENAVTYTEQELTTEEQAQARENIGAGQKPLIVKFTGSGTDDNPYTCDRTFEEIATAYNAGRDIKMHYNVVAAVFGYNDTVTYSGIAELDSINTGMQIAIFRDESSINFENVELVINEQEGICGVSVIVPVAGYNLGVIKADPAEPTDTIPARIGDDGKLYVDALTSSTLQSTINTALEQAKASGEFNGEDGTSVTITNTTESTEDGGENVVEFSDGNKLTVWNGKTGAQGDPGVYVGSEDTMPEGTIVRIDPDGEAMELVEVDDTLKLQGYAADAKVTGEKLDELSEAIADKLSTNQGAENVGKILVVGTDGNLTLTDMPEGGTSGDVVGVLDDSNNILLTGALADGTYTLKYVLVDEQGNESYTDIGTLEVGAITPTQYSITNTLANCTTSNNAQTIDHGANYSATITMDEGFAGHTAIYVTMGGVDISAEAVSGDNINIGSVTGDIIISCVAYKTNTRYSLSSFAETTSSASGLELTGYIPLEYGDTIYMEGVTIDADSTAQTMIWTDANFEKISVGSGTANSGSYTGALFGDVAGEVKSLTLDRSTVAIDTFVANAGIAYIRFTAQEISANSIITVNQPIE